MQIGTGLFYDRGASQLSALSAKADALNTQIATNKRLSAPSQDVVAYGRLAGIARLTADDSVHTANLTLAQSLLQQSDTTLSAVTTQLQRAQELTTQAANGTLNDADRRTIATELKSIRDDLVGLANTVDARGQHLYAAATGDGAPAVQAADGSVTFTGAGDPPAIPVGDGVDVRPSDSVSRVFGGVPDGSGGTTDVFAVLNAFIGALDAGGSIAVAAGKAADGLSGSVTRVTDAQGSVGARAARLDIVAAQTTAAAAARETDRSALEDTDLSTTITELQKTMTILQATQASFTKLGQLSLFDYLR